MTNVLDLAVSVRDATMLNPDRVRNNPVWIFWDSRSWRYMSLVIHDCSSGENRLGVGDQDIREMMRGEVGEMLAYSRSASKPGFEEAVLVCKIDAAGNFEYLESV